MSLINHQILLASRPAGEPTVDNFKLVEAPVPTADQLADGQVLVRHHYLSLDPYMRGRMNDSKSYAEPQPLNTVMIGGTVGEVIASKLFGPILRSHRISIEQMAILEPALSETVTATCLTVIREALDEAVKRGVPAEAARDFLLGHLNVELAILFDEIDWELSDGAKEAVADAMPVIFQPDWKKVFDAEQLLVSTRKITEIK